MNNNELMTYNLTEIPVVAIQTAPTTPIWYNLTEIPAVPIQTSSTTPTRYLYYSQNGVDPVWADVLASGKLNPIGTPTTKGYAGSTIDVDNAAVETTSDSKRAIPQNIKIHTLGNTYVSRSDFSKWSRWYREDGNTQVFRLFKNEINTANSQADRARIEAFTTLNFVRNSTNVTNSKWHQWSGQFLILNNTVKNTQGAAILQSKNSDNDWSFMVTMNSLGDITFQPRWGTYKTVAYAMAQKAFSIKVRDNGHNYEAYFNGVLQVSGSFNRPTGTNNFRWGLYKGTATITNDVMIFVSGAAYF